jgi:hypothetical protein
MYLGYTNWLGYRLFFSDKFHQARNFERGAMANAKLNDPTQHKDVLLIAKGGELRSRLKSRLRSSGLSGNVVESVHDAGILVENKKITFKVIGISTEGMEAADAGRAEHFLRLTEGIRKELDFPPLFILDDWHNDQFIEIGNGIIGVANHHRALDAIVDLVRQSTETPA